MKKLFLAAVLLPVAVAHAEIMVTPWRPIFKGIDHAIGTNTPDGTIPRLQVVHCVRVDLTDPDVQLFTTPPVTNYLAESRETLSLSVSNFIKSYGLAVAADANFYDAHPGGSDPSAEGIPCEVYGLQICTGAVVSIPDTGPDSNGRYASLLFTTNKEVIVAFNNRPPGISTDGIFTAVSGYYPVLSNGVNIGAAASIGYPDSTIHQAQPRTAYGVSQDGRYLFMMTIDGRQGLAQGVNPPYSDGANDPETATWMLQFGASDAINMDGGGSTAMYMADCVGNPVPLNHSSYIGLSGGRRERIIGSHLGVYSKPAPSEVKNLIVTPGDSTALVTWTTDLPGTTQVEYGPTPGYGSSTMLDPTPMKTHIATLTGLLPGNNYFFRAISSIDGTEASSGCQFRTTNSSGVTVVFGITNGWKYITNNLDGVPWTATDFDDSGWLGPGVALLYVEGNTYVAPKNTLLPPGPVSPPTTQLPRTYYFRTHFSLPNVNPGSSLTFSNFIDDGAVFYLNGAEVWRLRMVAAPTPITNATLALDFPCKGTPSTTMGDAATNCPDVFTISGAPIENLQAGDNVMAVEVHNYAAGSADIVFGAALFYSQPTIAPPQLGISYSDNIATLFWNGSGFTLQQAEQFSTDTNAWLDVTGPVTISPVILTNTGTTFFRLRN